MPTYTRISFSIKRSNLYDNLVRDFYDAVQVQNITASPCYEDISLEEAISRNQQKLDSKFRLGPTMGFSRDYSQIKLSGTIYTECRLYIRHGYDDHFGFYMIVPDSEVMQHGYDLLKTIAKSVVMKIPIESINSGDEIASKEATIELSTGEEMAIQYFGYVKDNAVLDIPYLKCTELNNGYFIEYSVG